MGDLNFRNQSDHTKIVRSLIEYSKLTPGLTRQSNLDELLKKEELSYLMRTTPQFWLKEQKITFIPTYKFKSRLTSDHGT